jgi:DNA-binding CsgD family transcriptional regulator
MESLGSAREANDDDVLTEKQRRVLDLLIENKTSKEIARALGISPYTVDQRISLARGKLGVASRAELAARYRLMRRTPEQSPSDISAGSEGEQPKVIGDGDAFGWSIVDQGGASIGDGGMQRGGDLAATTAPDLDNFACPTADKIDHRVGPEVFEGRSGGFWRVGSIVATALLLVMTILGLLAIFNQLNELLA